MKAQLMRNSIIEGVSAAGNPIGNNDLGGHAYFFEKSEGGFNNNPTIAQELMADADYLPTMQIKLLDGRNFSEATLADKDGSAIINETLMNQLGWDNAIGKKLQFPTGDSNLMAQRTVIGVVKDFHTYSLQHKVDPLVMIMPPAAPDKDNLYVRVAKGKEQQSLAYISSIFKQFDKTSTPEFHFLDQNFAAQYAAEEKQGQIALIFTILAVVIASLGLFGLATFTAQQRTKEIGIRKVLGASVASIATMLSKDFLKLVFGAACIALPLAWFAMNQWLEGFAYRVDVEWWILALAGFVAAFTALITVSYHAIKAALANPVKAIKTE
jgi:putative ABC transport system permease protein